MKLKKHPTFFLPDIVNNTGATLIGIIIIMIILASLGAALLSLTSTGLLSPVSGNSTARAYYLSESGFRFAASKSQISKSALNAINGMTYNLQGSANERFKVDIYNYLPDVTGGNGTVTLTSTAPFGYVAVFPTSGYLKIGNNAPQQYSNVAIGPADTIQFTHATATWAGAVSDQVKPVALSDGIINIVGTRRDFGLQAGAGDGEIFPQYNGRFTVDGNSYIYKIRENNRLINVTMDGGGVWVPPNLGVDPNLVLSNFIRLESNGLFGQGVFMATRKTIYHIPISAGGFGSEWSETFDTLINWNTTDGSHAIANHDGSNALRVTGVANTGGGRRVSIITPDLAAVGIDINSIWSSSGNFLSYDAQVKIDVTNANWYCAGISFRLQNNGTGYGISIVKSRDVDPDGLDNNITPERPNIIIILWERTAVNTYRWLAYKKVGGTDYLNDIFLSDDVEGGVNGWNATGLWQIVNRNNHTQGGNNSWYYGRNAPDWDYDIGDNSGTLTSSDINLPAGFTGFLSYWIMFEIEGEDPDQYDLMDINVRRSNRPWPNPPLRRINDDLPDLNAANTVWPWTQESQDISGFANRTIQVRFLFDTLDNQYNNYEGWYVDDIMILDRLKSFVTLLVRVEEKTAEAGDPLAGLKVNDIKVYIGDLDAHGMAGSDPQDSNRLANLRDTINWPPEDVDDTDSSNDHFTLIQWDNVVAGGAGDARTYLMGTGAENNSVIRNRRFRTPDAGNYTQPEIGLHALGTRARNRTYFDDFAIRVKGGQNNSVQFLSGIQE